MNKTEKFKKVEFEKENPRRIPKFDIGEILYIVGHDRAYHGIFIEQLKIESFIMDYPKGEVKIIWEFGNINNHKQQLEAVKYIKAYNPSDCIKNLIDAKEKILEEIKKVITDLEIKRADNIENIEGLKEILKLEIQDALQFTRSSNKIINQLKKIDMDAQFIKKLAL